MRGGPSHTYLLFWRGAVSSRSVISSGNISPCFGTKLFQGQDWSRHTHFLVLAWASSFEGLVQAPYFCFLFWDYLVPGVQRGPVFLCFGTGFVWFKDYPRSIYLLALGLGFFKVKVGPETLIFLVCPRPVSLGGFARAFLASHFGPWLLQDQDWPLVHSFSWFGPASFV